ncbi:MBL fold metallo-hydrolase [Planococcus lenghuensis]|uniref:MBL fold metallo-hydrolase n=1 Tax=Planococcus lenghuensis TaxID=2213202 RepID=UPI001E4D2957|nr:MBL fold metallo-hydrolase [Planococcus lenghuensis]
MRRYTVNGTTVFQSALFQTTSTVIEWDDAVLIVDPNTLPAEIEEIQQHVNKIRGNKACYLLFTHGDFDHIIGYRAFPDTIVIASEELLRHPQKERKLQLIRDFDQTYYITRSYPIEFPQPDIVISEDSQQIQVGSVTLTFYKAPGHSADSLFTVIDSAGVFLAGDYLSDFELPFIYHSANAYEDTLKKAQTILDNHAICLLIPGHGRHTEDRQEMQRRIEQSLQHLDRLKKAAVSGDEQALARLAQEHGFPSSFTEESHAENIRIIREESTYTEEKL